MNIRFKLTFILLMVFAMAGFSQENDVDKAREAIENFKKVDPDIGKLFESAYGYAVLPGVGKGGIGIGGAGGKGTVFRGGNPEADAKFKDGMLIFTHALGGLMYEASIGGQRFKVELY